MSWGTTYKLWAVILVGAAQTTLTWLVVMLQSHNEWTAVIAAFAAFPGCLTTYWGARAIQKAGGA